MRPRNSRHGHADACVGSTPYAAADLAAPRRVVDAFLTAARDGDFDALLAALHTEVVLDTDGAATGTGEPLTVRGAAAVASRARMSRATRVMPRSADRRCGWPIGRTGRRLTLVLRFAVDGNAITRIGIVADPARLRALEFAILD